MGTLCPLCWGPHVWTDGHEVVATAAHGDQEALIEKLSKLGVSWPAAYSREDPSERTYGLLRMLDDACGAGLDSSEVGGRWVVTRARGQRPGRSRLDLTRGGTA